MDVSIHLPPPPASPRRTAIAALRAQGALDAVTRAESAESDTLAQLVEEYQQPISRQLIGGDSESAPSDDPSAGDKRHDAHVERTSGFEPHHYVPNRQFQMATGALDVLRHELRPSRISAPPRLVQARLQTRLQAVVDRFARGSATAADVARFYEPGRLRHLDDQLPVSRGYALLHVAALDRHAAEDVSAEFARRATALSDIPAERRRLEHHALLAEAQAIAPCHRPFALDPLIVAVSDLPPHEQNSAHAAVLDTCESLEPGIDRSPLLINASLHLAKLAPQALAPAITRVVQFIGTVPIGERMLGLNPLTQVLDRFPPAERTATAVEVIRAASYLPVTEAIPILNSTFLHLLPLAPGTIHRGQISAAHQQFIAQRLRNFDALPALPEGTRVSELTALAISAAGHYRNAYGQFVERMLPHVLRLPDAPRANVLYILFAGIRNRPPAGGAAVLRMLTPPIVTLPGAHRTELLRAYFYNAKQSADAAAACAPHFIAFLNAVAGLDSAAASALLRTAFGAMRMLPAGVRRSAEPVFIRQCSQLDPAVRELCVREIETASASGCAGKFSWAEWRFRKHLRGALN